MIIFFLLFAVDNYNRITQAERNLFGFGYSFSNVGEGVTENGKPYFAASAVNINTQNVNSKVVLFKSLPMCINVRESCGSKAVIRPSILSESAKGDKQSIKQCNVYEILPYYKILSKIYIYFIHCAI